MEHGRHLMCMSIQGRELKRLDLVGWVVAANRVANIGRVATTAVQPLTARQPPLLASGDCVDHLVGDT
jgi:hypothetical protein